jgi:Domain of unknown function (DUF6456)
MTNPLSIPNAHSNAEAVSVLRQLARPNTVAEERSGDVRILALAGHGARRASEVATRIPLSLWQMIVSSGWVVPHENVEGWRISNAGAIALRRHISRTGEPGKCGPAVTSSQARPANKTPRARPHQPGQNDCESPLQWLSRRRDRNGRRLISDAQLAAGERLRADFTYGSMMPSITSSWSPVAGTSSHCHGSDKELEMRDAQLRARELFRAALAAVGPEFTNILVDVCCYLKGLEEVEHSAGWPQRSAKVVLLLGLSALARYYGLSSETLETPHRRLDVMPPEPPARPTEYARPLKQNHLSAVVSGDP